MMDITLFRSIVGRFYGTTMSLFLHRGVVVKRDLGQ